MIYIGSRNNRFIHWCLISVCAAALALKKASADCSGFSVPARHVVRFPHQHSTLDIHGPPQCSKRSRSSGLVEKGGQGLELARPRSATGTPTRRSVPLQCGECFEVSTYRICV